MDTRRQLNTYRDLKCTYFHVLAKLLKIIGKNLLDQENLLRRKVDRYPQVDRPSGPDSGKSHQGANRGQRNDTAM